MDKPIELDLSKKEEVYITPFVPSQPRAQGEEYVIVQQERKDNARANQELEHIGFYMGDMNRPGNVLVVKSGEALPIDMGKIYPL